MADTVVSCNPRGMKGTREHSGTCWSELVAEPNRAGSRVPRPNVAAHPVRCRSGGDGEIGSRYGIPNVLKQSPATTNVF